MSGWDLANLVEETAGNFWHVTSSQIYRELRTLEENGLVKAGEPGQRSKRLYTITKAGEAVFKEWVAREPGDYIGRVPLLLTVWFGDHVPEDDLDWYLRLHRQKHEKRHQFFQGVYDDLPDKSLPVARALRFGVMFEKTFLDWFDTLPHFGGVEEKTGTGEARPSEPEPFDPGGPPTRGTMGRKKKTKKKRS